MGTDERAAPAAIAEIETLAAIEAIKRLKYRYLRCLDQKTWDQLDDVLAPDCVAAYSGGRYSFEGREAIVEFLRETMGAETFLSSHRCHHPEIDVIGPDRAVGTWAMDDVVVIEDRGVTVRGAAFYDDEYRRIDGEWRISRTGYRRTYEELLAHADTPSRRLTASWWGTGGRSRL